MYKRILEDSIKDKLFKGKAIIITGARQIGKTTLSLQIAEQFEERHIRRFNCDNPTDRELLNNKDLEFLTQLIGDASLIIIDEGQKVTTIGQTIKLIVDFYKTKKQVLVTGSSSINLLDTTEEPLTGRKYTYTLFPLSVEEIYADNPLDALKGLETLLIFGSYPDIVTRTSFQEKQEVLQELTASYLYKDVFEFQGIKNADVLNRLLKAIALQLGSEVSLNELSNLLDIDKKTVERYISLLEKSFVIFRVSPYTKNKRREISRLKKVYFYDLGVRNALIQNFNFLDNRNDVGGLWENFMMVERMKYRRYHHIYANQYFWRTYDGSEVDLVEERGGKLFGYEFKWGTKEKARMPKSWLEYEGATWSFISKQELKGFVL